MAAQHGEAVGTEDVEMNLRVSQHAGRVAALRARVVALEEMWHSAAVHGNCVTDTDDKSSAQERVETAVRKQGLRGCVYIFSR